MNNEELQKKIDGLPKWAQEHIRDLTYQKNEATNRYNQFLDAQTPSQIWTMEIPVGTNKLRNRYVQDNRIIIGVKDGSRDFEFDLYIDGNTLRINGSDTIQVLPQASNAVKIKFESR